MGTLSRTVELGVTSRRLIPRKYKPRELFLTNWVIKVSLRAHFLYALMAVPLLSLVSVTFISRWALNASEWQLWLCSMLPSRPIALWSIATEWVTVALHSMFWIPIEVVKALFSRLLGWYSVKQLPSRHKFCVHLTTMHQCTVSFYSKPHTLLAEWQGCFTRYCVNTGVERIRK